jgi:hypothetical protein
MAHDCAMDACAECGFRYDDLDVALIAETIRSFAGGYRAVLVDGGLDEQLARQRPAHDVWSVLEYACHLRDVLLVQRDRALRALVEDRPQFPPMHREERVVLAGYADESLDGVAAQIAMAADLCARVFDDLSPDQLRRTLIYNYPQPTERDVAWLGRHTVHEGVHHLMDVRAVRARLS